MATKKSKVMMRCDAIEATTATQVRSQLNKDIITQYQEDIEHGDQFPPVVVFAEKGSARHILADGFHRLLAHVNAGLEEIEVDIHEGNMHDALAYALSCNRTHGLRRSNADKINAVKLALKDPVFKELLQKEIADLCGVSRKTVQRVSVRDTTDEGTEDKEPVKPTPPAPDDVRPTRPEPTQADIELQELRDALQMVRALPYPGNAAIDSLDISDADIMDLEYVSSWCAHAVLAFRKKKELD